MNEQEVIIKALETLIGIVKALNANSGFYSNTINKHYKELTEVGNNLDELKKINGL